MRESARRKWCFGKWVLGTELCFEATGTASGLGWGWLWVFGVSSKIPTFAYMKWVCVHLKDGMQSTFDKEIGLYICSIIYKLVHTTQSYLLTQ